MGVAWSVDLAVMLADGGEAISDLAVLRDQAQLFGPVASDPTAWRLLSDMDGPVLGRLHAARAQARELAWAQRMETRGGLPQTTAEPKKLRYRLLHVAARLTRSARRTRLHIAEHRPWATHLVTVFDRLAALPRPVT
jgi:Transposase DDE domain group 1